MVSKTSAKGNTNPVDSMLTLGLYRIRDKIIAACSKNRPYKIEGFGTWAPSLQPDSSVEVQFRPDVALINALNAPVAFTAFSEHIGKSDAELAELWNKEHPDNPVPDWITILDPE